MENVDISAAEDNESYATIASNRITKKYNMNETIFCPWSFDGYLCWPKTPAGTVQSQNCPDFVEGFSSKLLAHKT